MTRKLIEQMLEALDVATSPFVKDRQEVLGAIAAAREYLAQPESEARTEQSEPVGIVIGFDEETGDAIVDHACEPVTLLEVGMCLYTHPPQPKAPEPVSQMLLDLLARAHDEMLDGSVGYDIRDEIKAVLAAQRSKE